MANKLTIVIAGAKGSGRSTLAKFIFKEYLNQSIKKERFVLEKIAKEVFVVDTLNNNEIVALDYPNSQTQKLFDTYSVKVYSILDPLKKFCMDSLGLDATECYGSEDDKNSPTHISWEDVSDDVRLKYSRPRRGSGGVKPASGFMTSGEVIATLDEDTFRKLDPNCWARGIYSMIKSDGYKLAIIEDCSLPNEITIGTEKNAKVIKLNRKGVESSPLDDFPMGEFSLVVDNEGKSIAETHAVAKPHVFKWFEQSGLI